MIFISRMRLTAAALFLALASSAAKADGPFAEAMLKHLVEGDMSGRGTGQEGYIEAARWFANQLESYGFEPGGPDGSWFQNVPFIKLATLTEQSGFSVDADECISGKSIGISNFTGRFEGTLPVAFMQVIKQRPEITDGSLAGQLLVIHSAERISADDGMILKAKPACVLIVANDGRVRTEAVNNSESTPGAIPAAMVTRTAANALAARCGVHPEFFAAGDPQSNRTVTSSTSVNCRLAIERESIDVPNIVGWLPGSDESVRHEHICIGAHPDHLGIQGGAVFPGADDNGSGSAAILQVAKAIHANPVKPKRSVLVMAFCAEERGLLGSKHYVENPLKPLSDMICMLNIDMIGRNEESAAEAATSNENTIHLVGSRDHSAQLHAMVEKANQHVGFVFEYDEEDRVDGRSDHASFSGKGIPVTFLFGGFNPHYHQPSDGLEGINFSKIANAARLNYVLLMMAAEHGRFAMDVKK